MTDQKPHRISIPKYSLSEELLNAISHGLGALFGIVGTVLCIVKAANTGDPWRIVSGSIFGVTVLLLYLMSCLYHALKVNMAKRILSFGCVNWLFMHFLFLIAAKVSIFFVLLRPI